MYREAAYVERCACDAPAAVGCASCGRARCDFHLTRGLCVRCGEAIRRELGYGESGRFMAAMTLGAVIAFAFLVIHSAVGIALGVPAAIGAMSALGRLQRKQLIKRMGPSLAASKGELPPPRREDDGYPKNRNSMPGGISI